jgi:hypothetical protein
VIQSDQSSLLAAQHARCAQNSAGSSGTSGTNIGVNIGGNAGTFGQSHNNRNSQASSDCGSGNASDQASAALYYSQSVYHDVVEAWKACMLNRHQFACWAENLGDSRHLVIHARWPIFSARPAVVDSAIFVGSRPARPAFQAGAHLFLDDNTLRIERSPEEGVTVSIEVSPDGTAAQSCAVWVPPFEQAAPQRAPVQVNWTSRPAISNLPTPTPCTCLSEVAPPLPSRPGAPPVPFPSGSVDTISNNCSDPVAVFLMEDTVPQSIFIPWLSPAAGRRYAYVTLQPGQKISNDLGGVLNGITIPNNCPVAR